MFKIPPPTDSDEFEAQVLDFMRVRHSNEHLVRFGRRGQSQRGIDGYDAVGRRGQRIVWQATLQAPGLQAKLLEDLTAADRSHAPALFVLVVGQERDGRLQSFVARLSDERQRVGRCALEVLFWSDVREFLLTNRALGEKWYPELFPQASAGPPSRQGGSGNDEEVACLIALHTGDIPHAHDGRTSRLWYLAQLARICGGLSEAYLLEIAGTLAAAASGFAIPSYWSNGESAHIGYNWYYPNGETANIGEGWYYPNGENACIGAGWYYPNGETANIGEGWYHPSGKPVESETSLITQAIGKLPARERAAALAGIRRLKGQLRRLAIIDLVWHASPQLLRRRVR